MSKFKVGDRVRANKKSNERYSITNARNKWEGVVIEVRGVDQFRAKGNNGLKFVLTDEYFDLAGPGCAQKIVITSDGKTTTAKLIDGKKTVKEAVAKCSPDDTFDFVTGAKLAFERLTVNVGETDKPEKPKYKFKVGDRVRRVGTDSAVFPEGTEGVIVEVGNGNIPYRVRTDNDEFHWSFEKFLELVPEKPKYLSGKVVCVKSGYSWWTVGKVYEVKDGIITADDGDKYPHSDREPYKDFDDVRHAGCLDYDGRHNKYNEFIEFKG